VLQQLPASAVNMHVVLTVVVLQVKYQMLAAASFLAEVVKVLERVTSEAAAAASAEPDEDMVSIICWQLVRVQLRLQQRLNPVNSEGCFKETLREG
jgi:hypothetical protein